MKKKLRFNSNGKLDTRGRRQLKPCPFCGGEAIEKHTPQHNAFIKKPVRFWYRCENGCVEQYNVYETPLAATEAWDRRPK